MEKSKLFIREYTPEEALELANALRKINSAMKRNLRPENKLTIINEALYSLGNLIP